MFKVAILSVLLGLAVAYKESYDDKHSIELPVKSKHSLDIIKTPSHQEEHTTNVDIPGGVLPVYMLFKTQSSPLYVKQEHQGTKGSYQKSDSEDEPHKLVHEVTKPVIQELKEVITPYRKIVQVIESVNEERLTKVHKGERKSSGYGEDNNNNNNNKKYDDKDDDDNKYGKMEDLYKRYGMSWE